ncbi:MAG: ABC transporter permease subunit [Clostridiales bacterium]|nr:ABC transporter permease subunit [Clostridiales bacterium]
MIALIENEMSKMFFKKKISLILILLIVFIGLFAYGEQYVYKSTLSRFSSASEGDSLDWTVLANQQLAILFERLDSPYIPESGIKSIEIEIKQLQYFILNDINPITPSAARFTVDFANQTITMFIPLLILILASDLVSGEFTSGTIKLLMTRAVPRWKILLGKYIALLMMTTLVILLIAILSTLIAGFYFDYWGFDEPMPTGFHLIEGTLDSSGVIMVSGLQYMFFIYALTWGVAVVIASITLMISILVNTTATAIGIILSTLIGGQFLQYFLSDWPIAKYFYVSNLNLSKYLTGSYQPIEGMSLAFSTGVLLSWLFVSLLVSFTVFIRKDILV